MVHGSFSIKKVLPLFTNLSYKDLTVHNGTEAILTYGLLPTFTEEEYEKHIKDDWWLTAEEAVSYGIADEILTELI